MKDGHFMSRTPKQVSGSFFMIEEVALVCFFSLRVDALQRHFVLRIEDNWHPSLYYYEPMKGSDPRTQVFKGCVDILRATVTKSADEMSLAINMGVITILSSLLFPCIYSSPDPVVSSLDPHKFKGFALLNMYVRNVTLSSKNYNTVIMHFESSRETLRWNDAFAWVLPAPQAKIAKLVEEEQVFLALCFDTAPPMFN